MALISTNSVKSMAESIETLLVTLVPLVGAVTAAPEVADRVVSMSGTLRQLPARPTAAPASTTPKPYSWLNP